MKEDESYKLTVKAPKREPAASLAKARRIADSFNQAFIRGVNSTGVEISPTHSTRLVKVASIVNGHSLDDIDEVFPLLRGVSKKIAISMMNPSTRMGSEIDLTAEKILEKVNY